MHLQQQAWSFFQRHKKVSVIGQVGVVVAGLLCFGGSLLIHNQGTLAQKACASGDQVYTTVAGDTLQNIATRHHTTAQQLSSYNSISTSTRLTADQVLCIPTQKPAPHHSMDSSFARKTVNIFPYPTCTWWANERYHQLHGIYVPWKDGAAAWQWAARARQFHWTVSTKPTVGSIIDIQPWIQQVYGGGHVAIVERILPGGRVLTSNMNWGRYPTRITYVVFTPGPGITFIHQ